MKKFTLTILSSLLFVLKIYGVENGKDSLNLLYNHPLKDSTYSVSASESPDEINWDIVQKYYIQPDTVLNDRKEAKASFQVIDKHNSWVDKFSNEDIAELPIGVKHNISNVQYSIGITKATVNKDFTKLTVFARVRLPQTDKKGKQVELFFGANNVKLSHEGGIIGDAQLALLGDFHIPFNGDKWMLTLKGGFNYRSGVTENSTFVTIDCDGIKNLGIEGEVEFSRSLIIPVESNGEVNESKTRVSAKHNSENGVVSTTVPYRVKGAFKVTASDWNDILVNVKLQPFVIAKKRNGSNYKGNFQFYLNQAVLDFSDYKNNENIKFPDYYTQNGLLFPSKNAWKGIYVNTLEVKLPKEFKTSKTIKNDSRISFTAHHLLIDSYGISGSFSAQNSLFSIDEGTTGKSRGWAYSLDRLNIDLAANKLIKASFGGRILLPISQKENNKKAGLAYNGLISENEYSLKVTTLSSIDFSLWKAKAQLSRNSSLELKVIDDEFKPKAVLHGRLAISANQRNSLENEGKKIKDDTGTEKLIEFKGIEFRDLVLQTGKNPLSIRYLGYNAEASLARFPVSISKTWVSADRNKASLHFKLKVNLMGKSNGFAASTGVHIIGGLEEKEYTQKWKFKKAEIDEIRLEAKLGGFAMKGGLQLMNNDPQYGDGFSADMKVTFKALGGMEIAAKGIFGKKTFRYWQFDALADFPPVGTGINLTGFGGGASYRMSRFGLNSNSSFSRTGLSYEPNEKMGLSVKALVKFVAPTKESFSGNAGFEMLFNRSGGIKSLDFFGFGTFMSVDVPGMESISDLLSKLKTDGKVVKNFIGGSEATDNSWVGSNLLKKARTDFPQLPKEKMTISADLGISYDFENEVLHGELETYINTPGGFVQGVGAHGRAGRAVLHFESKKWYIYLGTPEDRMGVKMGIGSLSIKTGAYFMTGSVLKGFPSPPKEVSELLREKHEEINFMRNENLLSSGKGFAFGADISVNTGDLNFLIFYAKFQAGVGFDIMLKDYENTRCSDTGKQIGINGWYASGQAYAYLSGELGINIRLFFVRKKVTIFSASAAILLQAKLPNPIWMRGYLAGHYNVLGGLVKGRYKFKVTVGKECKFVKEEKALGGVKMISDLTPNNNATDVDVFAIPQASFNIPVGKPFEIQEKGKRKTYKIDLDKFIIKQNNQTVIGKLEWSDDKNSVKFISRDILNPYQKTQVEVQVSFLEKVNGQFKPAIFKGKPVVEKLTRSFKTGGAPTNIPLDNIDVAYPVLNQKFFLEKEYNRGYIILKRGQGYLFDTKEWKSSVSFYNSGEDEITKSAIKYLDSKKRITYSLPDVDQKSSYELIISSKSINKATSNTTLTYKEVNLGQNKKNSAEIRNRKSTNISKDAGVKRLKYKFATSAHSTLKEKINTIKTSKYLADRYSNSVVLLINKMETHEPFELIELVGTQYTRHKPLISIEAILDDRYFTKDIKPYLYEKYPVGGKYWFRGRSKSRYGVPPKFAISPKSIYLKMIQYNNHQGFRKTTFPFSYNLGVAYSTDWRDIQKQILNDKNASLGAKRFFRKNFPFMRYGNYKTKLVYKLPGLNTKGISNIAYKFKNPLKFR